MWTAYTEREYLLFYLQVAEVVTLRYGSGLRYF